VRSLGPFAPPERAIRDSRGNFVEACKVANTVTLLDSSVWILVAVVPIALLISTMGGLPSDSSESPAPRWLVVLVVFGLTLPFEGVITPLYVLARQIGILDTRVANVLPLIGLFMPFGVFWMRAHFKNLIPLLCAGTILILLPTLLVFILFQRQVIAALL
jgi:ABC-type glycerol-3-phosphate transport system permease component